MTPVTIDLFWIIFMPAVAFGLGYGAGLATELRK